MPLETADYINQLNQLNPLESDIIKEGDDHIRLIKKVLTQTFPNIDNFTNPTHEQFNKVIFDMKDYDGDGNLREPNSIDEAIEFADNNLENEINTTLTELESRLVALEEGYQRPINSIYMEITGVNPGEPRASGGLGYGTWVQVSTGRALITVGTNTDGNGEERTYTVGDTTDGEWQHTLTIDEIPSHNHGVEGGYHRFSRTTSGPFINLGGEVPINKTTTEVGGDQPHNNTPPILGVFVWQRTA